MFIFWNDAYGLGAYDQTIEVINQLDEKELIELGAVFEDISEQLQSSRFIECIEQLAVKYPDLEQDVLYAKKC